MMTGGDILEVPEVLLSEIPADVRVRSLPYKIAYDLDTLPTARIISLEEAKTTKGSVYFTKEGPIVWD